MSLVSQIYKHPKKSRIVIFSFVYLLVAVMLVSLYKNYEYNTRKTNTETTLLTGIRELKDLEISYQSLELSYRLAFVKSQQALELSIDKAQANLKASLLAVAPIAERSPEQKVRLEILNHSLLDEIDTINKLSQYYTQGDKNEEYLLKLSESSLKNYYTITNTLEEMTVFERKILYDRVDAHQQQDNSILKFYLFVGICFCLAMLPLFLLINHLLIKNHSQKDIYNKNTCLNNKIKQLKEENELLESDYEFFCYSVSHDLRAPIRAIEGFTNLLNDPSLNDPSEKARYLSIIIKESIKMSKLIDSLLEFTKTGRKELVKTTIDTEKLVKDVVDGIANKNPKAIIVIDPLPDIEADYILITQVFFNLIENALKFSKGKEVPNINIGFKNHVFFIRDNGIGFPNKYSERIFQLFQRLYPEKDYEGSGAGLSITKKIIERHGGKIWAEGEPEKGSTFYFELP